MRTVFVALALYLVIAFPFSGLQTNNPSIAAVARTAPEGAVTPSGHRDIIAPLSLPPVQGSLQATPISLTAEKMMDVLRELAQPAAKPTKAEMCETLAAAALAHELPVGFFVRLIQQESGFNPEAVSPVGAQGVAQFMPAVAEEWGLQDAFDPHQALPASARFLRSLREQFGNWGLAAAAYNGGMGRVQKWLEKRGKLPEETRKYVLSITGLPAEKWVGGAQRKANFTIPPRAPCQDFAHLADAPDNRDDIPLPRTRLSAKTIEASADAVKIKGTVKAVSKVAAVKSEIAAPVSIMADARSHKKGKRENETPVKVAEKSSGKTSAKAAAEKSDKKTKGKGRIQIADARSSRK